MYEFNWVLVEVKNVIELSDLDNDETAANKLALMEERQPVWEPELPLLSFTLSFHSAHLSLCKDSPSYVLPPYLFLLWGLEGAISEVNTTHYERFCWSKNLLSTERYSCAWSNFLISVNTNM